MRHNYFRWGLRLLLFIVLAVIVGGLAVMYLWNWLAPDVFGWHTLNFGQAVGLLVLCRLLIGGMRGHAGRHLHWRARLAERMEAMTAEEREKFRAGLHARCGWRQPQETPPASQNADT